MIRNKQRAASFLLAALFFLATGGPVCGQDPFIPLYDRPEFFAQALDQCQAPASTAAITGITVPHHLLAADLIPLAFSRVRGQDISRVVILGPDHFHRGTTPVSASTRDFRTCFGELAADQDLVAALLELPQVSESSLFSHEHAVQAMLPFVAKLFPQARVTALALDVNIGRADLDALVGQLKQGLAPDGLAPENVLIIQSTDFSHYLTPAQAAHRDQESLAILDLGQADRVLAMDQPEHIDSRAALYVQMRLQQELFGASCAVLQNRNSQHYAQEEEVTESTSYVAAEWGPGGGDGWSPPDAPAWVFGGDFFTGRFLAERVADADLRQALAQELLAATRCAPLVLNLEGALAASCPGDPGPSGPPAPWILCMEAAPTLALLDQLNARAVSLANNHAHDLGGQGLARTLEFLGQARIRAVEPGQVADMGPFQLVAFTDLDNTPEPRRGLVSDQDMDALLDADPGRPLVVMIHWGEEHAGSMDARQEHLVRELAARGADLILGAHSHRAGDLIRVGSAQVMVSLGNFLFDQAGPRVSGRLVRARFFAQGTCSVEVLDLPNAHAGDN